MARISHFLLAFCSVWAASAYDIQGRIQWNNVCTGIKELGNSRVILDDGKMYGGVTQDGSFTIPDVPVGAYILSVISHDHAFEHLRIDVLNGSESIPEVRPYVAGTPLNPPSTISLSYPIALTPRQKNVYFVPKESFNLLGMFQNPMMLMMVFAAAMMFGMPYILKNLDPEEFREKQGKTHNIHSSPQNGDINTGIPALLSGEEEPRAAASSVAAAKSQPKNRKNKKR